MSDAVLDSNFDICVVCGLGGNLVLCDSCPKVFHRSCIVDLVGEFGATFVCHMCKSINQSFTWNGPGFRNANLNDYISAGDEIVRNSALDLFASTDDKTAVKDFYTIGLLLSYLEWKIPLTKLRLVAKLTSAYFKSLSVLVSDNIATNYHDHDESAPNLYDCLARNTFGSLNFAAYLLQVRECIGIDMFANVEALLGNCNPNTKVLYPGLAAGLSSSLALMTQRCTDCGAVRYFRRFCYHCANIFSNEFWKWKRPALEGDPESSNGNGAVPGRLRARRKSMGEDTSSKEAESLLMGEELSYEASYTALCGKFN